MSTPESTSAPPTPTSPACPVIVPAHLLASRSAKVRDHHLDRKAIVYVRQSSPQQVAEHKESTARQYALADVAVALGWPRDRVEVIDADQGRSGTDGRGPPRLPVHPRRSRPRSRRHPPGPGGQPPGPLRPGLGPHWCARAACSARCWATTTACTTRPTSTTVCCWA